VKRSKGVVSTSYVVEGRLVPTSVRIGVLIFLLLLLIIYVWFCLSVFTLGVVPYKVYYWLTGDEGLARDLAILTFMVSVPGFYILTMFFKELYEKTQKSGA